jgi:cyanuric acid amidohydrolase
MGSPSDVSCLERLVDDGAINPSAVIAVIGKTEGNGCVNDFTRGYAVRTVADFFKKYAEETANDISYVMSGGTEGVLSPHIMIVSRSGDGLGRSEQESIPSSDAIKSLAVGVAKTRVFQADEIGSMVQVDEVAEAVRRAADEAGITDTADVHFVQIKCPLLTTEQIHASRDRSLRVVTEDTYKSMGYSRGASALGVASALGEIDRSALTDKDICSNWHMYSSVASASSGSELAYCEVIVFGNSAAAKGPYYIDHAVMSDAIDATALKGLIEKRHPSDEVVQVLAKAEADPAGFIRNRRHTMLDDSDINHTRHARAVVGGVLASVCGDPMIYVSGGAEHQGPAGGGPVAVIFRRC